MIGHLIHFHRRKAEAAFLSGVVTAFRRDPYTTSKGTTSHRTVFLFTPGPDGHIITDTAGWTRAGVKLVS
jgi:hypothetical protein